MAHDQPAAARPQCGIQLHDAVVDEFDPPVLAVGQRVENLAVEDECAIDGARAGERLMERRVVEVAQIAAEPDQCAGAGGAVGFVSSAQNPLLKLSMQPGFIPFVARVERMPNPGGRRPEPAPGFAPLNPGYGSAGRSP